MRDGPLLGHVWMTPSQPHTAGLGGTWSPHSLGGGETERGGEEGREMERKRKREREEESEREREKEGARYTTNQQVSHLPIYNWLKTMPTQ